MDCTLPGSFVHGILQAGFSCFKPLVHFSCGGRSGLVLTWSHTCQLVILAWPLAHLSLARASPWRGVYVSVDG